jgi:hypothetical protein
MIGFLRLQKRVSETGQLELRDYRYQCQKEMFYDIASTSKQPSTALSIVQPGSRAPLRDL